MQKRIITLMFETEADVNIGEKAIVRWSNNHSRFVLDGISAKQLFEEDVNWEVLDNIFAYVEKRTNQSLYILDEHICYDVLENTELTVVYADNTGLVIATALPQISEMILSQENIRLYEDDDRIVLTDLYKMFNLCGDDICNCECQGEPGFTLPNLEGKINKKENKEETNMFQELNFGGKITNGQFRMSINGLAVLGKENKYYTYNPASRELVEVTTGFFDQMNDLLFTMPTLELEVGDIILHQNKPYYVTVAKDNVIKGINFEDMTEDTLVAKTNIFNQSYFVKVFNCLGTNNILGSNIASNPTLAFALMGGQDMDLSKILMLQAMQGDGDMTDFSSNPMMLMALMSKDNGGSMNDFMKMQMMTSLAKSKKSTKKSEKAE